jgi:alkaline phosphatase
MRNVHALLLALAAITGLASSGRAQAVKHIILFVGDGMQLEAEIGTSRYLFGEDDRLSFQRLPYKGTVTTWDVTTYDSYAASARKPAYDPTAIHPFVGYDPARGGYLPFPLQKTGLDRAYLMSAGTDSASAATAIVTGQKTVDENVAWLPGDAPDGRLTSLAEILRKEKGFAIGVVSTVPFSHATPAAEVSHNVNRNNFHAIADEIVTEVRPDVVIGGGYGSATYMSPRALAFLTANPASPYVFVQRRLGVDGAQSLLAAASQAVAQGRRLFGLFGDPGSGNFESPVPQDQPGKPQVRRGNVENPLLKDAVVAALEVLSRNPNGFLAMFEQGDIDLAAHANDYRRVIGTTWDLHEAVQSAIAYIDRPGDSIHWGNTLLLVTADHGTGYLRLAKPLGAGDLPAQFETRYPGGEVSFGTTHHTNQLARLYARGSGIDLIRKYEGAWYPCTKLLDNAQLFHIMMEAVGAPRTSPLRVVPDRSACVARGNRAEQRR